ncbi:uncharacterized protein LOC124446945 [Xenia sp. Carnegie-2017]|uniref:uncharacterized protein LOC124446945 n=1 Tax=Xenia sp. Carnegie-2017 TaxID=2897299 RepID=UPI001F04D3B8|nr:uncharacterized protein LOC124446945 [Xenia sp. Carnegie-2017]
MKWLSTLVLIIILQYHGVEARHAVEDAEGIISIILLAAAIIVFVISLGCFLYVLYKLTKAELYDSHHSRPVTKDELDAYREPPASRNDGNYATAGVSYRDNEDTYATAGRSPYDNDDPYTTTGTTFQDNKGATAEEEEQVVATTNVVVQQSPVVNDVMVHQAPEPEKDDDNMQTQELTVIFDENDHVVDVLTNTI